MCIVVKYRFETFPIQLSVCLRGEWFLTSLFYCDLYI